MLFNGCGYCHLIFKNSSFYSQRNNVEDLDSQSAFQSDFCYLFIQNRMQTMFTYMSFFSAALYFFHSNIFANSHSCLSFTIISMIHFNALWYIHTHQYMFDRCIGIGFYAVYLRCKVISDLSGCVRVVHVFGSLSIVQLLQQPRNFMLYQLLILHTAPLLVYRVDFFKFRFLFRSCFYFSQGFPLLDWA